MTIKTKKAKPEDLEWINSKYAEVNFEASIYENEFIIIAEWNRKRCGLGRLIIIDEQHLELGGIYVFEEFRGKGVAKKIVSVLSEKIEFEQSTVWCLPFSHLTEFYKEFGFAKAQQKKGNIPHKITKKHKWCNENYGKTELLVKINNSVKNKRH